MVCTPTPKMGCRAMWCGSCGGEAVALGERGFGLLMKPGGPEGSRIPSSLVRRSARSGPRHPRLAFTPMSSGYRRHQREGKVNTALVLAFLSRAFLAHVIELLCSLFAHSEMTEWDSSKAEGEMLEVARAWLILPFAIGTDGICRTQRRWSPHRASRGSSPSCPSISPGQSPSASLRVEIPLLLWAAAS
jgi:hypothetical protein